VTALRALVIACVAAWLGVMAFFSFAVAPLVFREIDRPTAGAVVALVLPRYYLWGVVLCAIALAALLVLVARSAGSRWRHGAAATLCAAMLAMLGWMAAVGLALAAAARRARDDSGFAAAHRQAVRLNALTLAAGVLVLVLEGLSRDGRRRR
jgi:hypothetical protein